MGPTYVTREQVQSTLDLSDALSLNASVDRACRSATDDVEGFLHRRFYPTYGTRTFDVPSSLTLWLYENELTAAPESITSGGTSLTSVEYILQPLSGPPYRWIDINQAGSAGGWTAAETYQRGVSITGFFGATARESSAGTLSGSINSTTTGVTISNSTAVGVGDLLRIDSERMVVTEKVWTTAGATTAAIVSAKKSDTLISVSSAASFSPGETILVEAEVMTIRGTAGSNLLVERADKGTVLAAHSSGITIYVPRLLTVERAAAGTTAASHSGSSIYRNVVPGIVNELALGMAINYVNQAAGGWSGMWGAGGRVGQSLSGNARQAPGVALDGLREQAYAAWGRKTRSRAVMP